jgi:plastocyanin
MNKSPILVLLCILCLVLAGCSGGGSDENPRDNDVTGMADSVYIEESGTPTFNPKGIDDSLTISIKDKAFGPQTLTTEWVEGFRGSCYPCPQITWVNNDDKPHTITSDTGEFDSGPIGPGEQWMWTFINAGTYDYHCSYHEEMTGTIEIVKVEESSG